MMKLVSVLLISCHLVTKISARSWEVVIPFHGLEPMDGALADGSAIVEEADPFLFTDSPSMAPTLTPSPSTSEPSERPTLGPTVTPQPTDEPSQSPTMTPSTSPSVEPSMTPSASPTLDEFAPNPAPSNPPSNYFNYDPSSRYGPGDPQVVYHNASMNKVQYFSNGWKDATVPTDGYWSEFGNNSTGFGPWAGVLARHDVTRNRCDNIGKQSPIDVVATGAECFEHHQIRSRPGDMNIANVSATTKLIESNKLRLIYSRRPCRDYLLPECAEPDPPASDFPNNWGGYADVMHVDLKTPSEHTINGERFDGEMQIFHIHPSRRRTPAVSVMINASDTYNWQLQSILDQFQAVYDEHRALCATKSRRERSLLSWFHRLLGGTETTSEHVDYDTWANFSTILDDPNYNETQRDLQSRFWHPHHPELTPSIYFFGYEGSTTEPPCGEWVSWFIIDTPMRAHLRQVEQLKRLIFTHVSPDCDKTSVHYDGSVARPIQDSFQRPVWRCTSADFPADEDRET